MSLLFLQLNYQFMKTCVECAPVTEIQQEWFDNILQMIPDRLKSDAYMKEVIDELFQEISVNFNQSMKKSMGMYTYEIKTSTCFWNNERSVE
jgi:hypothetical protein